MASRTTSLSTRDRSHSSATSPRSAATSDTPSLAASLYACMYVHVGLTCCGVLLVCWQTKCGYQFLQEEQQKYASRGFTVLAFPCNQFGGQEPGGPQDIRESLPPPLPHSLILPSAQLTLLAHRWPRCFASHTRCCPSLCPPPLSTPVYVCCAVLCCAAVVVVSFAVKSFHSTFPLLEKTDVNGPHAHPVFAYLKTVYPGDVTWNFHGLFVINEDGIPIRRFFREPYPEIDAFIGKALDERDQHRAANGDGQATTAAATSGAQAAA